MLVIIAVVVVVAILVIVWWLVSRKRSSPSAPLPPPTPPAPSTARADRPEPPPMTGLEEALNRATDRSGTSMADRLASESETVEGFRVTDDTGPLLRRALDRLEPAADAAPEPADSEPPSET